MCTPAAAGRGRVRLNVGGRVFETTAATLSAAGRDTMLGAMLDASWNAGHDADGGAAEYFIDRDPACFAVLLDLLRTGGLHVPPGVPEAALHREALYYGLLDRVRAARFGDFDGDRLRLAASVPGRAPGDGTAVRAAPDGGCCVAHGGAVRVYNWMLEERRPVYCPGHAPVNDAAYLDAATLLVAARERPGTGRRGDDGGGGGGVAAFSALTGEPRHRFRVAHGRQPRSFTAGALAFDDGEGCRVFASCKGRLNEYGVAVWDVNTGEQAGFFYEPPGCALGDADRLQWLDGTGTLMAATMFPRADSSFISLLDFRDKSVVWSWSDAGTPASLEDKHAVHAVAMEDGRSVCVINQYHDLGFLDLRKNAAGVRWRSRSKLTASGKTKTWGEETCYPKLATHGGQLFASTGDAISVFSGPDHVLTSTLRGGNGGAICDLSIGGDRLFALHSEENVFDVWETPPPAII
ncbi:hypothetical protein SEVIR_1G235000v4 [Setaria viridis]|uniref:BTB domain-containing protein n=1 Tax=Setaria viridis TaxID=4556 RepID=A0A4U6WGB4_SETVI|nr:BTB/POZ domain-containing protein At2g24240-like [Setaria viridis]TKW40269.1 hypothetical protein SEVIR_1G235000v2 [Setaria viridis]